METVTLYDVALSLQARRGDAFYALQRMGVQPSGGEEDFRTDAVYYYDKVQAGKAVGLLLDKEAAIRKFLWTAELGRDILSVHGVAALYGLPGDDIEVENLLRQQGVDPISSPISLAPIRYLGTFWYRAGELHGIFTSLITLSDCKLWLGENARDILQRAGVDSDTGLYSREAVMKAILHECEQAVAARRV